MALSDLIGGAGGLLIAIPAVKDQVYRFNRTSQDRKATNSPWPGLRNAASAAWEHRRNGFDGLDSLFTLLGAGGIAGSFFMKIFGG